MNNRNKNLFSNALLFALTMATCAETAGLALAPSSSSPASSASPQVISSNTASVGGSAAPATARTARTGASANTVRKNNKLRYGKLLRSKPADPANFGLLKSYCNHAHGRRWCAKTSN